MYICFIETKRSTFGCLFVFKKRKRIQRIGYISNISIISPTPPHLHYICLLPIKVCLFSIHLLTLMYQVLLFSFSCFFWFVFIFLIFTFMLYLPSIFYVCCQNVSRIFPVHNKVVKKQPIEIELSSSYNLHPLSNVCPRQYTYLVN